MRQRGQFRTAFDRGLDEGQIYSQRRLVGIVDVFDVKFPELKLRTARLPRPPVERRFAMSLNHR
ncbi:hypothetical protein A6X20_16950 [Bradyrhizobium elkanii]|nr:hypothetical protein A6452_38810 [Bradyrhizobium elkanii]ODM82805.1 hypothetical protein A6X20_16950 [Bradyrhizobium elkanii]